MRLPASVRTDELHSDCGARLIDARNVAIRAGVGLSTENAHEAADEEIMFTLQTQKNGHPLTSPCAQHPRCTDEGSA